MKKGKSYIRRLYYDINIIVKILVFSQNDISSLTVLHKNRLFLTYMNLIRLIHTFTHYSGGSFTLHSVISSPQTRSRKAIAIYRLFFSMKYFQMRYSL